MAGNTGGTNHDTGTLKPGMEETPPDAATRARVSRPESNSSHASASADMFAAPPRRSRSFARRSANDGRACYWQALTKAMSASGTERKLAQRGGTSDVWLIADLWGEIPIN